MYHAFLIDLIITASFQFSISLISTAMQLEIYAIETRTCTHCVGISSVCITDIHRAFSNLVFCGFGTHNVKMELNLHSIVLSIWINYFDRHEIEMISSSRTSENVSSFPGAWINWINVYAYTQCMGSMLIRHTKRFFVDFVVLCWLYMKIHA